MTDINRHNYETFFLLYTDNELSVEEKNAVDDFVEANPDLQEELVMLQQSILKPDLIVFTDKLSLHKEELIVSELQQKLLLHLDNELAAGERNELVEIIKADTDIEKEWMILQQTKLSPAEIVVFEDKQSLYRKEAGRIVAFPWRKLAAAAIFIGFGVWGGIVYFNDESKAGDQEIVAGTPIKTNTVDPVKENQQSIAPTVTINPVKEREITGISKNTRKSSTEIINKSAGKTLPGTLSPGDKMEMVKTEKTNNLPKPYFENLNNNESNNSITANVKPPAPGPGSNVIDTEKEATTNTFASTASFTDNGEENNNRVLYMDEEKVKKTKLGGIFRKVKRVLERNANITSGGNNIKVANLEFAIQ